VGGLRRRVGWVVGLVFVLVVAQPPVAAVAGPIVPPGSVAARALSASSIHVSWAPAASASGYRVSRATTPGGPYAAVATVSALEYVDEALAPATTYYYVVQTVSGRKVSGYSAEASAATAFTAPTGVRTWSTETTADISWEPVAGAVRYEVLRDDPGGAQIVTPATGTSVHHTDLRAGTWYGYRVRAVAANGATGTTRVLTVITGPATTTTLTVAPVRSEQGQWVLLSASVRRDDGSQPYPGKVEFYSGDTLIAAADLDLNGRAEAVKALGPGPLAIYARFEGGSSWLSPAGSSSSAGTVAHEIDAPYGSVSFGQTLNAPVGSWEHAVAAGDLTGDGLDDVALTTSHSPEGTDDHTVFVFVQQADHSLAPARRYATSTPDGGSMYPVIADLDGDHQPELLVASGQGLDVFRATPTGLAPPTQFPFGAMVDDFVLTDVDGDGLRDVAATIALGGTAVRFGLPGGGYAEPVPVSTQGGPVLEVADVTGDGRADLVWIGRTVLVATQTTPRAFGAPTAHTPPTGYWSGLGSLDVGDVTGDGRADVVVTVPGNWPGARVVVLTHTPDGALGTWITYPVYDSPETVHLEDMNRDGRLDVVVAHGGWYRVGVLLQRPDGRLGREFLAWVPYASHYSHQGLATGDINANGLPDILLADYNNGLVAVPR
jgi:FG-GAP-like repeat/Fibronectin type III domain